MTTAWASGSYVKEERCCRLNVTVAGVYTGWLSVDGNNVIVDATPPLTGAARTWKLKSDVVAAVAAGGSDDGYTSF